MTERKTPSPRDAVKKKRGGVDALRARLSPGEGAGERRLLDLFLTAPVFVAYHLGVVFLDVRNGFDPITDEMLSVLHRSLPAYLGITGGIGLALFLAIRFTKVGGTLKPLVFVRRIGEATIYAVLMCLVARAAVAHTLSVEHVAEAHGPAHALSDAAKGQMNPFTAFIMSMGAGFYEELAFRVALFGGGVWLMRRLFRPEGVKGALLEVLWAVAAAACFSAVHYVGALGDRFQLSSFLFRLVCGLFLTAVFRLRGFATAVWTHALYDVGVMVF